MIDALYREGFPGFALAPPDIIEAMERGQSPFEDVSLILVSHFHSDHFDAQSVGRSLENSPKAVLVSSNHVTAALAKSFHNYPKIKSRVKSVTPKWGEKVRLTVNGIDLQVMRIRHGVVKTYDVENLGYVINVGGKKILHIGDADMTVDNFETFELQNDGIDIAFIPYWFLLFAKKTVDEQIQAKQVIAMHMPQDTSVTPDKIRSAYAGAIVFTGAMEKKQF